MKAVTRISPLLLAVMLAGCTLGPDFKRPDSQAPQAWAQVQGEAAASQPTAEPLELRWWDSFHDARLSALIQRVAERNLDLQMASARLLQSRALRSTVAADEVPSVDVSAGYSRARNSAEGLSDPSGKAGKSAFNLWQGDLVAGWELDLWGRVRRQVEAADASVQMAENDRRGVLLALLSETAGDYIQLRAVQHTLEVTQDNLKVARHSLKLSEGRQAEGVATRLDVAQASAQVASIEARLPTLEARRDDLINALSLLAAEPPRSLQAQLLQGGELPAPQQRFAIGVPSELAERRPDIRQAEARLHAATAQEGVAVAELFPRLTLSASGGYQAQDMSSLLDWASRFGVIGPRVELPIFDAGRRRANVKAQDARVRQAAVGYARTVLGALHEADNALTAYDSEQQRRAALMETVTQNRTAVTLGRQRWTSGVASFLDVLDAERTLQQNELLLADSTTAVSTDLVALYKALGGGWEAAPAQAAASPTAPAASG